MEVTPTETRWAAEIVTAERGDAVQSVVPVVGKGSVNKIFVCRTGAGEEVVVRMSSAEDEARGLSFYEKEQWCIEQAAARGVPGPAVLAIGRWETRPYLLQSFVPGINGAECPGSKRRIWHALGQHARLIHSISLDGFGETLERFHCGDAPGKWQEFVDYNIRSLTPDDELLRMGVYAAAQRDDIEHRFEQLRATPFRFGLNHGDLSPRNTIIGGDGTVHLLDWGSAEAHIVPHYDFLHVAPKGETTSANFRAFLGGYGMRAAEFAAMLPELQNLRLLKSFDLTRWAIDRCPERTAEITARAKEALNLTR